MKPIIEVKNISKKYKIGQRTPYLSLRDKIVETFTKKAEKKDEFWALQDVSFEVQPGESIGIIGKNGAGKSTLLKILSKITPPTKGEIICRGRVASLLEVGTGFHPELTGRENIFLNGAILGMRKREILSKFDEIIDFSGVEKFIDTPLKHYSSGMQLRLAFAVAAHLEPEILIVDEVLAVGDAEFQKKCMGKMEEVSKKEGRTVLFVSHNMGAVMDICKKGILLDKGALSLIGNASEIVEKYLNFYNNKTHYRNEGCEKDIYVNEIFLSKSDCSESNHFKYGESINVHVKVLNKSINRETCLGVALKDWREQKITTTVKREFFPSGISHHILTIPERSLLNGTFSIDAAVFIPNHINYDYVKDQCKFQVTDVESNVSIYGNADVGVVDLKCFWVKH